MSVHSGHSAPGSALSHVSLAGQRRGIPSSAPGGALASPTRGAAGSLCQETNTVLAQDQLLVPRVLFWKAPLHLGGLQLLLVLGVVPPQGQDSDLPLLTPMRLPPAPFSSRCPWVAEDPLVYQLLCPEPSPVAMALPRQQGTAWQCHQPAPSALRGASPQVTAMSTFILLLPGRTLLHRHPRHPGEGRTLCPALGQTGRQQDRLPRHLAPVPAAACPREQPGVPPAAPRTEGRWPLSLPGQCHQLLPHPGCC